MMKDTNGRLLTKKQHQVIKQIEMRIKKLISEGVEPMVMEDTLTFWREAAVDIDLLYKKHKDNLNIYYDTGIKINQWVP